MPPEYSFNFSRGEVGGGGPQVLEVCVVDGEGVRRTIGAGPLKEPKCERARTNIMRVSVSVVFGTKFRNWSGSNRCSL